MLLRRIELRDFRSYGFAAVAFGAGVTVAVGPNAQGKTSLLEAAHRVATGGSHRSAGDAPLVRRGATAAYVRLWLETDAGRTRTVELEIALGRRSRVRVDGADVRRSADAIGVLRVVLFAPEDVAIVRGDPGERRRFLDDLLAQRRPAFAAARADYERVLRQRNRLLRTARLATAETLQTLDVWTAQLAEHGAVVTAARLAATRALAEPTDRFSRDLVGPTGTADAVTAIAPVTLRYRSTAGPDVAGAKPSELAVALRDALAAARSEELARGTSLVGPHRDDLELSIGDLPARTHASQGEAWSLALALRLASYQLLAEVGDRPVVLLDDVFAELDAQRRERLAAACGGWEQVIVTAAVEADVPLEGRRLDVRRGDDGTDVVARTEVDDEVAS